MRTDAWRDLLASAPFLLLLAVLPYPHTVTLRLTCLALAFAIAAFAWRASGVPPVPCKAAIGLWALVALVSLAYAVDPGYSLTEIKNEIGYTMMAFVAFFAWTRSDSRLRAELLAVAAGATLLCAWAVAGSVASGRWDEAAGHGGSGNFAAYAVAVLPVLLLLGADARYGNARLRVAAGLVLALVLVASLFSTQRALWPVFAAQFLLALWLARRAGLVRFRARTMAVAVAAVVVSTGAGLLVTQSVRFESSNAAAEMIGADQRWQHWPEVAERILENPWAGAGFGRQAMSKGYRDLIPADHGMFWHAHNTVLDYGLAMGLPGAAALLLLFACLARRYWLFLRHDDAKVKWLGVAGAVLLAGVLLRNQVNDFFVRDMALLFWALNGAFLGLGARLAASREHG